MWFETVTTVGPATEPVSLADAKLHCRVDDTASDDIIADYIEGARSQVETITGTRLVSQTVEMRCSSFYDLDKLPVAPVSSITSVEYVDDNGDTQTFTDFEERLFGLRPSLKLNYNANWPSIRDQSLIVVTAVVGYSTIPPVLLDAVRLGISLRNEEREIFDPEYIAAIEAITINHKVWSL